MLFWQKVNIEKRKKEIPSLLNIQKIPYFRVFFEKDHLSFSV